MKKSILGSASFHAAILLAALFGLPVAKMAEIVPPEAIQVDISNITDNTKVKAQTKSEEAPTEKPKPKTSKAVEKVKPKEKVTEEVKVAAKEPAKAEPPPELPKPEPPPPEPKKQPPPPKKVEDLPVDPDPLKAILAAEEKKLEEEKKAEEKKQVADKKKAEKKLAEKKAAEETKLADEKAAADAKKKLDAEKKKRKLDVAQLEDLLNKENTESSAPVEKKDTSGTPEKAAKDIQGSDDAMSATIVDGLRQKFEECWTKPPAVSENAVSVDISFELDKNGQVIGQPVITGGDSDSPFFQTAGLAARSAVMKCQPFDWLPRDRYDLWKSIEWTFKPR